MLLLGGYAVYVVCSLFYLLVPPSSSTVLQACVAFTLAAGAWLFVVTLTRREPKWMLRRQRRQGGFSKNPDDFG